MTPHRPPEDTGPPGPPPPPPPPPPPKEWGMSLREGFLHVGKSMLQEALEAPTAAGARDYVFGAVGCRMVLEDWYHDIENDTVTFTAKEVREWREQLAEMLRMTEEQAEEDLAFASVRGKVADGVYYDLGDRLSDLEKAQGVPTKDQTEASEW